MNKIKSNQKLKKVILEFACLSLFILKFIKLKKIKYLQKYNK